MAQLLAAAAVRGNRPPARACGPPGRLFMNERGLPTDDTSYRHEVYVSPAIMRNLYSMRPPAKKPAEKRRRLQPPPAAPHDALLAPGTDIEPAPAPAPAPAPEPEPVPEPEPLACSVCLQDIDAFARAVGCPRCSTLLCPFCYTKNLEYNLRTKKPMSQCPGCRQDATRMVEKDASFAITNKPYVHAEHFDAKQPATCILCCDARELDRSDFGCRQCVHFTACRDCTDKIQDANADNKTLNRCPCCKEDKDTFIPYPRSEHAKRVGYVEPKPKPETCYFCNRAIGGKGDSGVSCPLCDIFVSHLHCWRGHQAARRDQGLAEDECFCCYTPVQMRAYEP